MLLLAEQFKETVPFEDATPLLGHPERLKERAFELGYLYFSQLLPQELVDPVRAYTMEVAHGFGWVKEDPANPPYAHAAEGAYFTGHGWDDPRFVEMQHKVCFHATFKRMVMDPRIMEVLAVVFGEPAALAWANHVWLKLPGSPEHTTLPHQDTYYLPDCPRMWTVWYPLVDTPMAVGPLGIVPGSHKTRWPHVNPLTGIDLPKDTTFATKDVYPGDLVAFDASTIHCAWSNVSPEFVRLSLDVRYEPLETKNSVLRAGMS